MPDHANVKRHRLHAQLIATTLAMSGLDTTVAPPRPFKKLSDRMADDARPSPDILLPGFFLRSSAAISAAAIGPKLDGAAADAADGQVPVVIAHRRSRPVVDSLVVLTLSDFSRLVVKLAEVDT